jgi:FkbM family methyltransferase
MGLAPRSFRGFGPSIAAMARSGRFPSNRALAALAQLGGWRLQRRRPFLRRLRQGEFLLEFQDLLELQFARSRDVQILVVGAFDGVTNDPTNAFVAERDCRAIFVEPQPTAFARLRANWDGRSRFAFFNAAIDQQSGTRTMYCVPPAIAELPPWTEQLASFNLGHLLKHEEQAPGLSEHIVRVQVPTLTFDALLDVCDLRSLDVLQIDAEGLDAQLLGWFPFGRLKPALLHYEIAHMTEAEHSETTGRLEGLGYSVMSGDSATDEIALLL